VLAFVLLDVVVDRPRRDPADQPAHDITRGEDAERTEQDGDGRIADRGADDARRRESTKRNAGCYDT